MRARRPEQHDRSRWEIAVPGQLRAVSRYSLWLRRTCRDFGLLVGVSSCRFTRNAVYGSSAVVTDRSTRTVLPRTGLERRQAGLPMRLSGTRMWYQRRQVP